MKQKTSLVIGGTQGIGSVIKDILRERGDCVFTVSRRKLQCKTHISVDLSSIGQISDNLTNFLSKRSKINNMVFCQRYRGNDWKKEFHISFEVIQNVIDNVIQFFDKGSSIVVVNSTASRFISDNQPLSYHVARAALDSLVRYYAVNLGGKGIRFNSILPATLIKPENSEFFTKDNPVTQLIEEITPLRRMGNATDVAYLVEFLCSDKSSFITGQSIIIDGGVSLVGQESIARILANMEHPKSGNP